ncbi:MAG TPA: cytochrome P450 [Myxococcota bacterium]|nr:cytochrome P450 [Myxococcota bacterium]
MSEADPQSPPNPDPETGKVNLFSPEFAACPHAVYRALNQTMPVSRQAFGDGPVLSRYEDVLWALRHPEIFSSEMEMQMSLGTERPMIPQQIDPPAQTKYRKILDPRFSRKRMAEIEPDVRRHANQLIDRVIDAGGCQFGEAFAVPLPCHAFLSLMGLPQSELGRFLAIKDDIIRPHMKTMDPDEMTKIREAAGKGIYAYFRDVIRERRAKPGVDLVSYLCEAEIDGEKLSDNEILDICFLMILAGLDTVTATLGCSIAYLASNPEQRERLVRDPALIPSAVEELLRWETPVTAVPRVVKQDVEIHGFTLKAGEMATLLIGASNLDDGEFEHADRVDFARARNRHIAFGSGPHRCLGSHLARLELEIALEEWHRRIPVYAIAPGELPRYSPGIREVQHLPLVWNAA